jgi:hypothetical protein
VRTRATIFCLTVAFSVSAGERPGDWTDHYYACDGHTELSKPGHMNLGVRFATSKAPVATAFARAMSFWANVLDMEWHTENGRECAIQVVDGHAGLFASAQSARAQFPTARSFQGCIAFNPRMTLPANELFTTAVHEIGHLLGLPHSANPSSVMYFLYLDGPACLDSADISALAARHTLRPEAYLCPGLRVTDFQDQAQLMKGVPFPSSKLFFAAQAGDPAKLNRDSKRSVLQTCRDR